MARTQKYVCTSCGRDTPRERLLAKKVQFVEMGVGGRNQKSRVIAWLCPDCVAKDVDWNREKFKAPGHTPQADLPTEAVRVELHGG